MNRDKKIDPKKIVNILRRCASDADCYGCEYWNEDGGWCDHARLASDCACVIEESQRKESRLLETEALKLKSKYTEEEILANFEGVDFFGGIMAEED